MTLRTGCFCNPGACQRHLKLSDEELKAHFKVKFFKLNLIVYVIYFFEHCKRPVMCVVTQWISSTAFPPDQFVYPLVT